MKICRKCKKEKDISEFYKNKVYKDGLSNRCKLCDKKDYKYKENFLTEIEEVGKDQYSNKTYLYKCICGEYRVYARCRVKSNTVRSCGCIKNKDKIKPFPIDIVPEQYKDYIEPDIGSFSLSNHHHAQWHSRVRCLYCNFEKLQRNERVIYSIKKYGCPYICQKCVGKNKMKKSIEPSLLKEIQLDYINSNLTWEQLAKKYNLGKDFLYTQANGKVLTKLRRLKRRKDAVQRMENELLEHERIFVENQKKELDKYEKQISSIIG